MSCLCIEVFFCTCSTSSGTSQRDLWNKYDCDYDCDYDYDYDCDYDTVVCDLTNNSYAVLIRIHQDFQYRSEM
jgi:hypothetical protein